MFGLDLEIIKTALIKGIKLKVENDKWVDAPGNVALVYHPQLKRFILVFGSGQENAGLVLLEDYKNNWELRS